MAVGKRLGAGQRSAVSRSTMNGLAVKLFTVGSSWEPLHCLCLNLNHQLVKRRKNVNMANRDSDFMEWLSATNPLLMRRYPTYSRETQLRLKTLHLFSLQADGSVNEVLKTINKCEQEYESLAEKTFQHLQLLGLDEDDDFSCDTLRLLQEAAAIICQGTVGDGSDAGAASALASDFLHQASIVKQKLSLTKEIKATRKRNERLRESLQFLETECKMASDEVSSLQSLLEATTIDLSVSQAKQTKLSKTVLDDHGVSPAISDQTILDTYNNYNSLQDEIRCLEEKFKQYGELPPSIAQASDVVQRTKEHLESVSDNLKEKLKAAFQKRS